MIKHLIRIKLESFYKLMIKRIFEVIFSISILLLTMPIILFSSIIIFFEDFQNPLFIQPRLGKNKKIFSLYKLRTMSLKAPQLGTHEVNSALYLKSSYFIRKLKIDELPQFINVVKGEMSIVGPRPCLPSQNKLVEFRSLKGVFNFHPGITGISQLKNIMMDQEDLQSSIDSLYEKKETKTIYFYLYCMANTAIKFDRELGFLNTIISKNK